MTTRVPPDCVGDGAEVIAHWERALHEAEGRRSALWLEAMASASEARVDFGAQCASLALRRAERAMREEIEAERREACAVSAALSLRSALGALGHSLFPSTQEAKS